MLRPRHAFVHLAAGSILIAGALIWAGSLAGCVSPAGSTSSRQDPGRIEPFDNWYPADITPPAGTQYPCALTALPPELEGIPGPDHRYINHVYSQVLTATRAKLALLRQMGLGGETATALADYDRDAGSALAKIRSEPIPAGLEPFQRDVLSAIELQRVFFAKATDQLGREVVEIGRSLDGAAARQRWQQAWSAMFQIPEGRQASSKLIAAWSKMQQRYPGWDQATKDSIYHHLCALDLF